METKYRHFIDEEFIRLCHDKRQQSPIIEELCQRLEEYFGTDKALTDEIKLECKNNFTCQVCEAKFSVEFDNESDELKVSFLT